MVSAVEPLVARISTMRGESRKVPLALGLLIGKAIASARASASHSQRSRLHSPCATSKNEPPDIRAASQTPLSSSSVAKWRMRWATSIKAPSPAVSPKATLTVSIRPSSTSIACKGHSPVVLELTLPSASWPSLFSAASCQSRCQRVIVARADTSSAKPVRLSRISPEVFSARLAMEIPLIEPLREDMAEIKTNANRYTRQNIAFVAKWDARP